MTGFDTPVDLPPPLPVPFTMALAVSHLRVLLMTPGEDQSSASNAELAWADISDLQVRRGSSPLNLLPHFVQVLI